MASETSVYSNAYFEAMRKESASVEREVGATKSAIWFQFYMAVLGSGRWGGELPKDCWQHQPEEYLINWGKIAAFKDDEGEFQLFPCYGCGELLKNGFYSRYAIIAKNGKMWYRNAEDIEICLDNSSQIAPIWLIGEYGEKTGYAYAAVDTALQRAMLPLVFECQDESDVATITDFIDKGESLKVAKVLQSSKFSSGQINVTQPFDNGKNDVLSLWDVTIRYRNVFYNLFGFNAVDILKKERLTERESEGNDEITMYSFAQDRYDCRMDFIDRVEKKFGVSLEYKLNRKVSTLSQMDEELKEERIESFEEGMLGKEENQEVIEDDSSTENSDTGE